MLLARQNGFEYVFMDGTSPGLTRAIEDMTSVQTELLTSREQVSPQDGFLISRFDNDEIHALCQERAGRLILCRRDALCVGYSFLTSIEEFTALFAPDKGNGNSFNANRPVNFSNADYFYQIGVRRSEAKGGVGSRLMALTKESSSKDLVADILVSPVSNDVSIRFFLKHDFHPAGLLTLSCYRDFGQLRSEVFIWNR